jgi:hypothetical protein
MLCTNFLVLCTENNTSERYVAISPFFDVQKKKALFHLALTDFSNRNSKKQNLPIQIHFKRNID